MTTTLSGSFVPVACRQLHALATRSLTGDCCCGLYLVEIVITMRAREQRSTGLAVVPGETVVAGDVEAPGLATSVVPPAESRVR